MGRSTTPTPVIIAVKPRHGDISSTAFHPARFTGPHAIRPPADLWISFRVCFIRVLRGRRVGAYRIVCLMEPQSWPELSRLRQNQHVKRYDSSFVVNL